MPLIVLTADRPPELRDTGAGQAIDQIKLYGSAAKWFVEVGNHEPGRDAAVFHRALACRAWATAAGGRPGPVHLNFPLREPLAPGAGGADRRTTGPAATDGKPWVEVWEPPASAAVGLATDIAHPRAVLVAGPAPDWRPSSRWQRSPPRPAGRSSPSRRRGSAAGRTTAAMSWRTTTCCCATRRWAEAHLPRLAIRIGDTPTSKPLRAWLARTEQIVLDPYATWHEPTRTAQWIAAADPALTCADLAETIEVPKDPQLARGLAARPTSSSRPRSPMQPTRSSRRSGPRSRPRSPRRRRSGSARRCRSATSRPSSRRSSNPIRFLANRGANGIDGVVSSAAGAALAAGGRAWLLTGELACSTTSAGCSRPRAPARSSTIVCANNGGGNIFDFLPLAEHGAGETFEEHVITPSGIDFAQVAALAGMEHRTAATPDEVQAAAAEPGLVEVRTDRAVNVRGHREVYAQVSERLSR